MDITELVEFKSVKELKSFLKSNSIPFSSKFNHVSFEYSFWDTSFNVATNNVKDVVVSISLEMNSAADNYSHSIEILLEIKEQMIAVWGKPELDNTNHLNPDDIYIKFVKDDCICELFGLNDCEFGPKKVFLCIGNYKSEPSVSKKRRNIISQTLTSPLVIFSIIGGFVWGLAMYGLMGLETMDYALSSLCWWMFGGLLWGILFAFLFGLTYKIVDRNPEKVYRKLEKAFQLEVCPDVYTGNSICSSIDKKGIFHYCYSPALLHVTESGIIMHLLVKNKPYSQTIPLFDACKELLSGHISFTENDHNNVFVFRDYSMGKQLEDDLCSQFIDHEQYLSLFECFKKTIVDYNPYSVYNTNDSGVLDKDIGTLTNAFLISDNISESTLLQVVSNTFSYNDYTTEALTALVSKAFVEWKNKDEMKEQ